MNIGIFVHSKTGNTLSVAQKLQDKLISSGHTASILRISATNDEEVDFKKIKLNDKPDVLGYDILIFGAPVRGFSLSAVMQSYLTSIESLEGRKTACFMTQSFPYPWMGGNRALKQLCKICIDKGANIYETGIVNWSNVSKRKILTEMLVEKLSNINSL